MTIRDHLEFYGALKGLLKGDDLVNDVDNLLWTMKLWKRQHTLAGHLSGGLQRRLCVAIAFVGGNRTIILDEPTNGVDPMARRYIWELIVKNKTGKFFGNIIN